MTTQPDLFLPMCATTRTRQRGMFDGMVPESDDSCDECGRPLIETPSGYWCCPAGHGMLKMPKAAS